MLIDAHNDTAVRLCQGASLRIVPQAANDYERLRRELDIAFWAIFLDRKKYGSDAPLRGLCLLEKFLQDMEANKDIVMPLFWREELSADTKAAKVIIALEGGELLGQEAELLPLWYRLGLRSLGLTWNYRNQLADGCLDQGGISNLGREVIKKCNDLGIIVDAAHLSARGFYEALENSDQPVIVSHSACQTVYPHCRNLDDGQLKALAKQKGVIGITFVRDFTGGAEADINSVVRHIVHAAEVAGTEHVGIGSDFDGAALVNGLCVIDDLPLLWQALSDAGFNENEIGKISGGNIHRILECILPRKSK